jgi:hypothetical protein
VFALGRVGEGNDAEPGERPVQGGVEDGGGAARVPGHTGDGSPAVGVGVGERAEGAFQGIVQGGGIDQETLWEGGGPGEQARAQRRPGDAVSGDQQGDNPGIGVGHTYPGLQQAHTLFGLGLRQEAACGGGGHADARVADFQDVQVVEQRQQEAAQVLRFVFGGGSQARGEQAQAVAAQHAIDLDGQGLFAAGGDERGGGS